MDKKISKYASPEQKEYFEKLYRALGKKGTPGYNERLIECIRAAFNAGYPGSSNYWIKQPLLNRLYKRAHEAHFLGQPTWNEFLRVEIGVVPHRMVGNYFLPLQHSRESLRSFVIARTKDTPLKSGYWARTSGLRGVIKTLQNAKFFEHGTWRNYIEKEVPAGVKKAGQRRKR